MSTRSQHPRTPAICSLSRSVNSSTPTPESYPALFGSGYAGLGDYVVRSFFLTASMLLASSLVCFGETLDGHLMPSKCKNEDMKTHTKECALACKSTGFGIVTASGEYVSFNRAGNTKAGDLLR